jgi:selenocysteine-specific elongation factor
MLGPMYVIGTAGHVDHGKSRLVLALTGIDPDRLQEEKARGLTIDLGFAWFALPSGREVSIVDVPGHERFIKNMLAGVGGIDLALFVVAGDEGVMPQTREHLAILDLLQVRHGIVALTKSDLVDDDWLDLVEADVGEVLAPTTLANAPIVRCSAVSGAGMDALREALDNALDGLPAIPDIGRPRLPIDRIFTVSGFGTVATGTLVDGQLHGGDQVAIEPGGRSARIRGLQSHKKSVDKAQPGTRTAVNLSGVAPEELSRGMIITTPGWLHPTQAVDVRLRMVDRMARALRHNASVTMHTGASEVAARVRLLEGDELAPGDEAWAQLRLEEPIAAARGDYFVVRNSVTTLGGGRIVDTQPRRHKRNQRATLNALQRLLEGSPDDTILTVLQRMEPVTFDALRARSELDGGLVREVVERQIVDAAVVLLSDGELSDSSVLATAAGFEALASKAGAIVAEFVAEHPLRSGILMEELRSRLRLPSKAFAGLERRLVEDGRLVSANGTYDLPDRSVTLSPEQDRQATQFLSQLKASGSKPSSADSINPELAIYLEAQGAIVRAAEGLYFDAEMHASMVDQVVAAIRQNERITLAEVRDMFGTSRKIAQGFLEDMDRRRITRRVGDARILRVG